MASILRYFTEIGILGQCVTVVELRPTESTIKI